MTPVLPTIFDKRFVIIAGKGGVGKSVVCAALGLAAAKQGRRTIIAELNTREKAPIFFGKKPGGYQYQELAENLYSINILPEPALHEYGLMKLRFERVYRLVFENEAMKRLIRVVPGMNELFLLGKAFNMERERKRNGDPAWDLIIVDAPATGHGVTLLRLPDTIMKVAGEGPMADEVGQMRALLLDKKRTLLNLVTLPEEMPVRETFELAGQVNDVLGIPKGWLIVNGIWPEFVTDGERQILGPLAQMLPPDARRARAGVRCLEAMIERRAFQSTHVAELRQNLHWPMLELPYLFTETFDRQAIEKLSACLIAQLEKVRAA